MLKILNSSSSFRRARKSSREESQGRASKADKTDIWTSGHLDIWCSWVFIAGNQSNKIEVLFHRCCKGVVLKIKVSR
ncbi:hypothetical protein DPMN_188861 [Dreissena polymorpha]|uniref:Uncharacterized protein n=1 Tax=Dreissena polymorpha TaxID=45954 RepID=A0A9D4DS30_DREPO|nr:hypothetical protein DPMN_188861 [Dreissena polymorpha]